MRRLSDHLRSAVRSLAYQTSVEQLKKKGVDKVNMVSMDRLIAVIDEAVHRGLRHHLVGAERERVIDATKEEFLRLLKSHEELEKSAGELRRLQERAQEEIDVLRRELSSKKQLLEKKLQLANVENLGRFEGENAEIAERFAEVFAAMDDAGAQGMEGLRDGALQIVLDFVQKERRSSLEARQAAHDREVGNLQRRIAKLTTHLEETEQRMAKLAALKNVDDGISSIYRTVQGLDHSDALFEKKSTLMAEIFKANLALQTQQKAG